MTAQNANFDITQGQRAKFTLTHDSVLTLGKAQQANPTVTPGQHDKTLTPKKIGTKCLQSPKGQWVNDTEQVHTNTGRPTTCHLHITQGDHANTKGTC